MDTCYVSVVQNLIRRVKFVDFPSTAAAVATAAADDDAVAADDVPAVRIKTLFPFHLFRPVLLRMLLNVTENVITTTSVPLFLAGRDGPFEMGRVRTEMKTIPERYMASRTL